MQYDFVEGNDASLKAKFSVFHHTIAHIAQINQYQYI